jgi:DNA primase
MATKKAKDWVDFKEIKARVGMLELLERYGLFEDLENKDDEWIGYCPIHDKEGEHEKNSFRANTAKNNWQCFACKKKGNVLDFVAEMEEISIKEAGQKIVEWFLKPSESAQKPPQEAKKERSNQIIGRIWIEDVEKRRIYFPVTLKDFEGGHEVIGKVIHHQSCTNFVL